MNAWGAAWGGSWGASWGSGDAPAEQTQPSHGHGDNGGKRRTLSIFKPTGLVDRKIKSGKKTVDERVRDSIEIHAEVSGQIAREFLQEPEVAEAARPVVQMSLSEIDREIGILLRKKLRTEEDELLLVILIAACA